MKTTRVFLSVAAAGVLGVLGGCGGGGSKPTPPPAAITVSLGGQPPTSLTVNAQTALTANVANDSASAGVKWTVTCGSSGACGSFSNASTGSGASTTYTAPSAVPSGSTVTVTATSVTDGTKTASATITITQPTPTLANGTYVFHLSGQDNLGQCFTVGAFTVANGAITGGEQDFSDSGSAYSSLIAASGSSLSAGSGSNLQITLKLTNANVPNDNGVLTFRASKTAGARWLISEYDGFATGSGSMDLQTSTAAPSGSYAFLASGVGFDTSGKGIATGLGGILNISGTSISLQNSIFDLNFGTTLSLAKSFTAGSVSTVDSMGRFSISLTPDPSVLKDFVLTGYTVGPNQVLLIESQTDNLKYNLGGTALAQGNNAGNFNQNSLSGKAYVYGGEGSDSIGAVDFAGVFGFNTDGTLSGPLAINDLTNYGEDTITGGTYTVGTIGRVTLEDVATQHAPLKANYGFVMYLDGNGNALILSADDVEVSSGPATLRTTSSPQLAGGYALAGRGFVNDSNGTPWSAVGPQTISSANYSGFTDYNDGGSLNPNITLSGSESSSTGVLTLMGLNPIVNSTALLNYAIDNKHVVTITIDQDLLGLLQMESTQ